MWYQLLEDATEGYERSRKIQHIKQGLLKAIDWEFLIIAFVYRGGQEAILVGTGRWEGDGYRLYLWDRRGRMLHRIELDTHDTPKRQRFFMVLSEIERITDGADAEIYAYQSIYNPIRDSAKWKEVRL
jgi:hypothetical protein